mgnify:CR=1 FL=1
MNKQKSNIINHGFKEIFSQGIKSFTVDNLASILCISKKTIYSFFPSKEILIDKIIKHKLSSIDKEIEAILKENDCPLVAFYNINEHQIKLISNIDINKVAELKIKYPDIWVYIEKHRKNKRSILSKIFKRAQDLGYLRNNLNPNEVARLYSSIINRTFQPEFFIQEDVAMKDTIRLYIQIMSAGIFNDIALNKINSI